MRTVYRISQEGAMEADGEREKLLDRKPELAELATCAAVDQTNIECRIKLAEAYFREGLLFSAYTVFNEVLKMDESDFQATLGMARIWDKWEDYSSARRFAGNAIAIEPGSALAHEVMGSIHLHRNAPAEALAEFRRSLDFAPGNPVVSANLGYAQMLLQNWQEAKTWFEKALSIDSTLAETRNNLGIVLAQMGDYEGALAQMQRVSGPAVAYNNLGLVLLVFRKLPAAAADAFEQALRYAPDYEKARANLTAARALLPPPAVINLPPSRSPIQPVSPVETSAPPEHTSAVEDAVEKADEAPLASLRATTNLVESGGPVKIGRRPTALPRKVMVDDNAAAVAQRSLSFFLALAVVGLLVMTFLTSRRLIRS
jgi:Tfp pilus assembly protein PilF